MNGVGGGGEKSTEAGGQCFLAKVQHIRVRHRRMNSCAATVITAAYGHVQARREEATDNHNLAVGEFVAAARAIFGD